MFKVNVVIGGKSEGCLFRTSLDDLRDAANASLKRFGNPHALLQVSRLDGLAWTNVADVIVKEGQQVETLYV